jgi:proteic killer suppression protein
VIASFKCRETARFFEGGRSRRFDAVGDILTRKLRMLHIAATLDDLKIPPGNRLEALKGDRAGQHSIRVNDQFRLCFVWTARGPAHVECVDYH